MRDRLGSRDDSARHQSRRGSRDEIDRRRNRDENSRRPSRDDTGPTDSRHPPRLREASPILPDKADQKGKAKKKWTAKKRGPKASKNYERSRTSTPLADAQKPSASSSKKTVQSQPIPKEEKTREASPINLKLLSMIQPKKP